VIHRGFDISSTAHVKEDMPLLIAPQSIKNQSAKKTYSSFGFYLLEMISMVESIIGNLIESHLQAKGLFQLLSTQEEMVTEIKTYLANALVVPDWVKNMASSHIETLDHEKMQLDQIKNFVTVLKENVFG
ncbi:hypothetical protein HGB13_04760, partial [bacterium]|nr:hypothetical protein [bacterium]